MQALLEARQGEVFDLLQAHGVSRFFLRRATKHHCLWVSDLPRWTEEKRLESTAELLRENGFPCHLDASAGLMEIDLSLPEYAALLAPLPLTVPAYLPDREVDHPAYALCRLLLLRPSPLEAQPLAPLRGLLKAAASPDRRSVNRLISGIHEECALWLREGKPLPHAAGRVLADWLVTGGCR